MKLLREPLLHFLFICAAIYLAFGLFAEPVEDPQDNTLVVDAGEIEWMATSWYKRWNRLPTRAELDGLIQQYVRETILYREALTMGLDRDDVVIRRRLAQKLEFLAQDLALMTPPTDEELQDYFNKHRDRYRQPTRYTFTQVYIDPDKRGDKTLDDAKAIKASLIAQPEAIDNAGELEPEQWQGPVLSGYGTHLVYVHNISEPPPPVFGDARARMQQDWEDERRETMNEQFYAKLRDRYTIVIEKPEEGDMLPAVPTSVP